MALVKQPVPINFQRGLDTKSDPFQVQVGNFLALNNSVFTTTGRLTKRNGYKNLTQVAVSGTPAKNVTTVTTLNDNLVATGSSLYAYSADTNQWSNQGSIQPVKLSTLPLIRTGNSQSSPDTAISASGLICLAYVEGGQAYYQISDSTTGQQIVSRQALVATAIYPRAFLLGSYFIVMYLDTSTTSLRYVAIPTANPTAPLAAKTAVSGLANNTAGWDGIVLNMNSASTLYIAYGASGSSVKVAYVTSGLQTSAATSIASTSATLISIAIDTTNSLIWIAWYDGTNILSASFTYALSASLGITTTVSSAGTLTEITSVANAGLQSIFYQVTNNYSYQINSQNVRSDYIATVTCNSTGTPGAASALLRSVGLASKAFTASNGNSYMVAVYGNTSQTPSSILSNQSTYFLIDSTGHIYMRMAYENAGGYMPNQVLPSVNAFDGQYLFPYLMTDFLASVNSTINTNTSPPVLTQTNAIYTQTGVNLAKVMLTNQQFSSEIASTLNLTGGILWEYDGIKPVENNFLLWPENVGASTANSGGSITAQTYFYVFCYEWTNNAGNIERSAPSIPVSLTTTGSVSTNTLNVPTLRLTYKTTPNAVRIVGYRWSQAQQVYYQFTSVTAPTANNPATDSVTFTDTQADSSILGNPILYTTGDVVENLAPPASIASALFDNRLWLIDAEDQNLLWFSKQVIENVPVEMSDLLTYYVAPTTSAQGSTGTLAAIYPMDDKLILFKKDAIYYINGTGPDNTGANSGFSQPIFVTSSVGSTNPNSIVLIPSGLMFQSDKGIWLLGRDLSTKYIGTGVESFNSNTVLSASNVPGTTQARFILDNDTTLMYDYFFDQWATHSNVLATSGTLYQGLHTYLNSQGYIFQENPGSYLDGGSPVLMNLTTGWINVAGLQGFERFYFANLLGTYFTPFKLQVGFAFNYNPSPSAYTVVTPNNFTVPYGDEAYWGSGTSWGADQEAGSGSPANIFSARLWPSIQKCQSFQVQIQEVYDSSLGAAPGEGLTLSGLALIIGVKKGYRTQSAAKSFG